ncbi:TlpA family protein disulfide reductase [Hymenobacter pini]|uniref:TlpA family protein disulfide reductase n=1 Tax=Hymenobacter pini TaxID=2880879 RepID=UPI001CF53986|nr:redoxin domain-containing protein [Hymenobacter pini]MCA8833399.1 redoxin domain-containing protein [Hymenobacter pini]
MRLTLSLLAVFYTLCSCSNPSEITYEEQLSICTKNHKSPTSKINKTNLEAATQEFQLEQQIRECMKGAHGPAFKLKTYKGDSINTVPTQGKAVVLFFWSATLADAPDYAKKSDSATFAAMNTLCQKYDKKVDFIGFPFNDSITVKRYLQEHPLYFPQVYDRKISSDKYILLTQNTTNYTIFINTQGRVVKIVSGSFATESRATQVISTIIQACTENKPYNK